MISLSTKLLTVDRISRWMSVRSAVCARRVIGSLLRDSGVRGYRSVWATAGRASRVCLLTPLDPEPAQNTGFTPFQPASARTRASQPPCPFPG